MITEDYVSFETAKLLKNKGFKNYNDMILGKSGRHYNINERFPSRDIAIDASMDCEDKCPLVTIQAAMKWLREVHKLGVFPTTYYRLLGEGNEIHDYGSTIVNLNTFEIIGCETKPITGSTYTFEADTYEETAEKAIKYCLENLI